MKPAFLLGRLIFGGFFLYNGINHLRNHQMMAQYTESKGVPLPKVAVVATGGVLILGGASILLGVKPRLGSAAILGFLAGVSPVMHGFWRAEDPQQRQNDLVHFSKNMAMVGAALALMGVKEPWPVSLPVGQSRRAKLLKMVRPQAAA